MVNRSICRTISQTIKPKGVTKVTPLLLQPFHFGITIMTREAHLVYHDKCMDGLLGAAFMYDVTGGAGLWPMVYPQKPDALKFVDKDVIIIDYIVDANLIMTLLNQGNRVFCLDHHIASLPVYEEVFKTLPNKTLLKNLFVLFNTSLSGAALCEMFAPKVKHILENGITAASKYKTKDAYIFNFDTFECINLIETFKVQSSLDEPDQLLYYLSNADTYTFPNSLTKARHIRLGIEQKHSVEPEVNFMTYLHLYRRYKNDWSELESIGAAIEADQLPVIDAIIDDGSHFEIGYSEEEKSGSGRFAVLYCEHDKANTVAQRYFSRYPDAYFMISGRPNDNDPTILNLSIRGQNDVNPFNLSDLAKQLDGGGHFNAAGGRILGYTDETYRDLLYWDEVFAKAQLPVSGTLLIE